MNLLRNHNRFSFLYDGKSFTEYKFTKKQTEKDNVITTEYLLDDGLKITNVATKYPCGWEWVNYFENTSDKPSLMISDISDCDINLELPHEDETAFSTFITPFEETTQLYSPVGSTCSSEDFSVSVGTMKKQGTDGVLKLNSTVEITTTSGRSSEDKAPFFNIHKNGKGYIIAIGWTGQWFCNFTRNADDVLIKSGIMNTDFKMLPGEKFRTSSVVIMPYEGDVVSSQNKWRRFVKENFSLIGKKGRDSHGPLCALIWGGLESKKVLERIDVINKNNLPTDYVWMDAGWYGVDAQPSPDEFRDDWFLTTGDWRVSKHIHPDGLCDVSEKIHSSGKKFLLWFEPERVCKTSPIMKEHPEYFLPHRFPDRPDLLLNLGDDEAWEYCFKTLSEVIEKIGIDCYRQDCNCFPYGFFRYQESEDRKGVREIKYINGLYKLWDALLEKFPHLIIDNCASGGRRIDIETLRRSIPLWRSDAQCFANYPPEIAQCHTVNYGTWMPYSGSGTGRLYDTYRIRSSYSPAMAFAHGLTERENFGENEEEITLLKKHLDEYVKIRDYLTEDMYPLTQVSTRTDIWSATQYDRPENGDGMIQVFRRENSPYNTASFNLGNINTSKTYTFTDIDTNEEIVLNGNELITNGFEVKLKEKRSSKIYLYKRGL